MGWFDYIRVHPSHIPPWSSVIGKRAYEKEAADLTTEGRAQTKELFNTCDGYEVAADGRLLLTTNSYLGHVLAGACERILQQSTPVAGTEQVRWMQGFSGTLQPGPRLRFRFVEGRLTASEILPTPAPIPMTARQRRMRRAQQLVRIHGMGSRKGKKWSRIIRRGVRPKFLIYDELHFYSMATDDLAGAISMARHRPMVELLVTQDQP